MRTYERPTMTRFIDRLASMPLLLLSGGCGCCGTVMIDCNYAIPAPPLTHLASKVQFHAKWHYHKHRHAAGHHGARMALLRGRCPIFLNEGGDNAGLGDSYNRYFGGDSIGWGGGDDFGGYGPGSGFGGVSGGSGGGSSIPPDIFLITDYYTPSPVTTQLVTPPVSPPCCGSTPPVVVSVPETSTWMMMVMGLLGMGWLKWRRA